MVQSPEEKQHSQLSRSGRQFRPILGSIVFLLAANLLAKGVLGLSAFNTYVPQNNLQGSLYLNFGQPNHGTHQPQHLPYTYQPFQAQAALWTPINNNVPYPTVGMSTPKPAPISQQQIINIHESPYADQEDYQDVHPQQIVIKKGSDVLIRDKETPYFMNEPDTIKRETIFSVKDKPGTHMKRDTYKSSQRIAQQKKIERPKIGNQKVTVRTVPDLLFFASKHRHVITQLTNFKTGINRNKDENEELWETTTEGFDEATVPADVEVFSFNTVGQRNPDDDEITTIARQMQTTTTTTTTAPTTTSTTTVTTPTTSTTTPTTTVTTTTRTTTLPTTTVTMNMTASNDTGYNYTVNGYGPYTGNENVSLTTMGPLDNMTMNATMMNATMGAANATGNATTPTPGYYYYPAGEYGPSNGNENISITYGPPVYDQPFFSSPEDQFLNQQQHYEHHHEYGQQHQEYGHHEYEQQQHEYEQHHEHNSNNYYENNNNAQDFNQFPFPPQYNDIVNKFYNKYDYHYPSFYKNF